MIAICMLGLVLSPSVAPAPLLQGEGAPACFRTAGRRSDDFKIASNAKVQVAVATAGTERKKRVAHVHGRNENGRRLVAEAKRHTDKTTTAKGGEGTTKYVKVFRDQTNYVASVSFQVLDETKTPVKDLSIELKTSTQSAEMCSLFDSTPDQLVKTGADGTVSAKELPLPAAVSVEIAQAPSKKAAEWALDAPEGEGVVLPLTIPDETALKNKDVLDGDPIVVSTTKVGKPVTTKNGKNKTITTTYDRVLCQKVRIVASEPILARREVVDFFLPKAASPIGLRSVKPKVFLGDLEVDLTEQVAGWGFQVPRDKIDDGSEFVLQADTGCAGFGAKVVAQKPDPYALPNKLPEPSLVMESFAEGKVVLAGKCVDDAFPLSPLQWRGASAAIGDWAGSDLPTLVTGEEALRYLGVADKLPVAKGGKKPTGQRWIQVPGPANHAGRYGQWIWLEDKGLGLRCRWELDEKNAGERRAGKKFLPARKTYGILEAIRVVTPEGGNIGGILQVGSDKQAVLEAFGDPDVMPMDVGEILKIDKNAFGKSVLGDAGLEYWDDTFLYGGVRVKWSGGKVKWFEIARPVQLLYNGTKAFDPPSSRTVFVGDVRSAGTQGSSIEGIGLIRQLIGTSSGVVLTSEESGADFRLGGSFAVSAERVEVQHTYSKEQPQRDKNGNIEYDKNGKMKKETVTVNENFYCPAAAAKASLNLDVKDASGSHVTSIALSNASQVESVHTENRRCIAPALDSAVSAVLAGCRTKWDRPFGNVMAELSEMAGTVIAVNYETGEMLINLGTENGIRAKSQGEGTEFEMFILHSVDPKTGSHEGKPEDERVIGTGFKEWLEVQRVGPNYCVAQPKVKGSFGKTGTAFGIIPRLIDPGSGLVRVRIMPKKGATR